MSQTAERSQAALRAAPRALTPGVAQPLVTARVQPARNLRTLVQTALVPYLSRQVQSVGRTGVAGAALLVFAVAFFYGAASPLRSELAQLQATLDSAHISHGSAPTATASAPQAELDAFVKRLPSRAELPALTGQIVDQAAAAGISLERGTYDFTVSHSGKLVRARLSFPVHGSYPDIRRFVDGTLTAIPGAAVDALRFERKSVGDAEVDADVRFAIYLRTGS